MKREMRLESSRPTEESSTSSPISASMWNPRVIDVDKTSSGPISAGTTFVGRYQSLGVLETQLTERTASVSELPQHWCVHAAERHVHAHSDVARHWPGAGGRDSAKRVFQLPDPVMAPCSNNRMQPPPGDCRKRSRSDSRRLISRREGTCDATRTTSAGILAISSRLRLARPLLGG
jgi:hypothetical protein